MDTSWDDFSHGRGANRHGVRLYHDDASLASAAAAYLVDGFDRGDPAVVVATPPHGQAIADALAGRGWDAARVEQHRFVATADAEGTLAAFTVDGEISAERFHEVVGTLLVRAAARFPGRRVRVFGEMVDLLAAQGDLAAAIRLEELWNELAVTREFTLMCAYRVDIFDRHSQLRTLPALCRTHSHVVPADDPDRLARAVDAALAEVVGADQAGRVYALALPEAGATDVPLAELALMWISRELPALAKRVLVTARRHYVADAPAAARA